uniref:Uncharacterized protein n=1 Tax=Arundo donax TaxID=35708 RepID=A0A0A9DTI3_ARUDO
MIKNSEKSLRYCLFMSSISYLEIALALPPILFHCLGRRKLCCCTNLMHFFFVFHAGLLLVLLRKGNDSNKDSYYYFTRFIWSVVDFG